MQMWSGPIFDNCETLNNEEQSILLLAVWWHSIDSCFFLLVFPIQNCSMRKWSHLLEMRWRRFGFHSHIPVLMRACNQTTKKVTTLFLMRKHHPNGIKVWFLVLLEIQSWLTFHPRSGAWLTTVAVLSILVCSGGISKESLLLKQWNSCPVSFLRIPQWFILWRNSDTGGPRFKGTSWYLLLTWKTSIFSLEGSSLLKSCHSQWHCNMFWCYSW